MRANRSFSGSTPAVLDVRPEAAFIRAHLPGSASIPLEELSSRSHELPATTEPVEVIDDDASRADSAAAFLRQRGHVVAVRSWVASDATGSGTASVRLWKPSPFLVEALEWMASHGVVPGRALDVACGSGRDSVYLAMQGHAVEALDILPDALARARDLARRCGVMIDAREQHLEREPTFPQDRYDLVIVFRYLQRSLFPALRQAVCRGGYVVYETFHERNRQTGRRPLSPDHLLTPGELERAFDGFEALIHREGHEREGRFFSSLLARRR